MISHVVTSPTTPARAGTLSPLAPRGSCAVSRTRALPTLCLVRSSHRACLQGRDPPPPAPPAEHHFLGKRLPSSKEPTSGCTFVHDTQRAGGQGLRVLITHRSRWP